MYFIIKCNITAKYIIFSLLSLNNVFFSLLKHGFMGTFWLGHYIIIYRKLILKLKSFGYQYSFIFLLELARVFLLKMYFVMLD